MLGSLASFFASFNPFTFAAAFSLGVVILVRTPERLLKLGSALPSLQTFWTHHRRGS